MASRAEVARELEITRRELDEMAEELADIESRVAEMVRLDIQIGDTREWLDRVRERHASLERRFMAAKAEYEAAIADKPERTH